MDNYQVSRGDVAWAAIWVPNRRFYASLEKRFFKMEIG